MIRFENHSFNHQSTSSTGSEKNLP